MNLVRVLTIWSLCWMMAVGTHLVGLKEAYGRGVFSPVTFRMAEEVVSPRARMPLDVYQALGLDGAERTANAQSIEAAFRRSLPILERANYSRSPEFLSRLNSGASRSALLAELSQASYLIESGAGRSAGLNLAQEASRIMDQHRTLARQAQPHLTGVEIDQRARATSLAEVIENHKGRYGEAALRQRQIAYQTLADQKQRNMYDFRNGIREGRAPRVWSTATRRANQSGHARIVLPGTRGQSVLVPVTGVQEGSMAETMKNIRQGVGSYGIAAGAFLLLAFGYTLSKMTADYASNPMAFEDVLNQYIKPVYFLSFFTFGMAATTYQMGHQAMVQKNIEILYDLSRNGHLWSNRPLEKMRVAKSAFAGLSFGALAFGFAASMGTYFLGEKVSSCLAILNDGPMSRAEREQHESACNMTFMEFLDSSWPTLVTVLPSLMAAKYLMVLAGQGFEHLRGTPGVYHTTQQEFQRRASQFNNRFNDPRGSDAARRALLKGVSPGLPQRIASSAPQVVRFFRTAGAITVHMAGFVILIEVIGGTLRVGSERVSRGFDVESKEGHLRMSHGVFLRDNLSAQSFCRVPDDAGGCLESETIYGELLAYQNAMDELRLYNMRGVSEVIDNWSRYFSKSLNMYQASGVFYRDVVGQITAKRRVQNRNPFRVYLSDEGEYGPDNYWRYAQEGLPLFRSSPLFGVRPEVVNESFFSDLSVSQAITEGVNWDEALGNFRPEEMKENLSQKMILTSEAGLWLQEQAQRKDFLESHLQERASEIGNLLRSSRLDHKVMGLELLAETQKAFPWSAATCRINPSFVDLPECTFFFAQELMMDVIQVAAEMIQGRLEDGSLPAQYIESAQTLVELLGSPLAQQRSQGLSELDVVAEAVKNDYQVCEANRDENPVCVFRSAQALVTAGPFNHRNRPDYGGYVRDFHSLPMGPRPLAPGHKYFMDFYTSLDQLGIDYDWYPARGQGGEMGSMSHYLLTSMICGPETFSEQGVFSQRILSLFPGQPEFHPPRLPTISGGDHCRGLRDSTSVYHHISGDRSTSPWRGAVDLLYHDLSPEATAQGFSEWWRRWATEPFENLILQKAKSFSDDLNNKYKQALLGAQSFWGGLRGAVQSAMSWGRPVSYMESIKGELDTYFWSLFYPIYNDSETLWYEPNLPLGTVEEVETFKSEYLNYLESHLFEALDEAVQTTMANPSMAEEAFAPVEHYVDRLRQLFQGWTGDYEMEMVLGLRAEYPQLSYRNRAPLPGGGYEANKYMLSVFQRIDVLIGSLKLDLMVKSDFFEEMTRTLD